MSDQMCPKHTIELIYSNNDEWICPRCNLEHLDEPDNFPPLPDEFDEPYQLGQIRSMSKDDKEPEHYPPLNMIGTYSVESMHDNPSNDIRKILDERPVIFPNAVEVSEMLRELHGDALLKILSYRAFALELERNKLNEILDRIENIL